MTILRKPRLEDAEPLFRTAASKEHMTKFLTWRPHRSVEETADFIRHAIQTWSSDQTERIFAISVDDRSDAIGIFTTRKIREHEIGLGFFLSPIHWRKGIMGSAVEQFLQNISGCNRILRISALVDVDNYGSKNLLEKVGFSVEGTLRSALVHPNISPTPRNCVLLSLIRGEGPFPKVSSGG